MTDQPKKQTEPTASPEEEKKESKEEPTKEVQKKDSDASNTSEKVVTKKPACRTW